MSNLHLAESGTRDHSAQVRHTVRALRTSPPVWAELVPLDRLGERLAPDTAGHPLAVVMFGSDTVPVLPVEAPAVVVPMPQCGGERFAEVWFSRAPVSCGAEGGLRFAQGEELLFGALQLPDRADGPIEAAAHDGYARVLEFSAQRGFPHFLRMWNHFPAINAETGGLERYRQFCIGRYQAFAEHQYVFGHDLPAASAVGTPADEGLTVYFLACRTAGAQVENPRQVSAFQYPSRYGPRSPSFSRAIVKQWAWETQLYLSGTASIVGHETLHPEDLEGQLQETLRNMEAVLANASGGRQMLRGLDERSLIKVYLRDPSFLQEVAQGLRDAIGGAAVLFVQGDICRSDLLLEIEAVIRWSHEVRSSPACA